MTINPILGKAMRPDEYAHEWRKSAAPFKFQGDYKWMNDELGDATRVLEIGCGTGEGTIALAGNDRQVVSIEENSRCADMAVEAMEEAGVNVDVITVGELSSLNDWTDPGVRLVVADALSVDVVLNLPDKWFDAITCWLIGSHPSQVANALGTTVELLQPEDMAEYRTLVQKRCFDIAKSALQVGGAIHFVDRIALINWSSRDEARRALIEKFVEAGNSDYAFPFGECFLRKLSRALEGSSVPYVTQGALASAPFPVLASVRGVRLR